MTQTNVIGKVFKTKTGFCHITADEIILTRDGVIGTVAKVAVGNKISRILVLYGLLSIGLIYLSYDSYIKDDAPASLFLGLIATYLIYGIISSRNNSAAPIIDRKSIQTVTYNPGIPGLTRPRFEISFADNGQSRKRLIMLPGTLSSGQTEAKKAVQMMKEEGLLK